MATLDARLKLDTKITLETLALMRQLPVASIIDLVVEEYVRRLPSADQELISQMQLRSKEAQPLHRAREIRLEPTVTYEYNRLCFIRRHIEPLGEDEAFRVTTPVGTFQMTKREFQLEFPKIFESTSWMVSGIYHYPVVPTRALKYRL
jgi:hypothetical protein